jgi:hypothetical protein
MARLFGPAVLSAPARAVVQVPAAVAAVVLPTPLAGHVLAFERRERVVH